MSLFTIPNVSITGISACVPPKVIDNRTFSSLYTEKEVRNIIKATGIRERRFAEPNVCSSDLACQAADKLLHDMTIDRNSIDMLLFLSQTPDYLCIPPTSCILQDRLGLSHAAGTMDMVQSCSGIIYGLASAMSFAALGQRVLLLFGETLSRTNSVDDRSCSLLFGDAGAAILVEPSQQASKVDFSLNTDGSLYKAVMIPAGGYRNPFSTDALVYKSYPDDSKRYDTQGVMDGMAVYDFTQREVIPDIRKLLAFAKLDKNSIDYFFFHQANKMIIDMFTMELDVPAEKAPVSLDCFGNTSAVSIPLGIVADFGKDMSTSLGKVLLSGFGSGLSWGCCTLNIQNCFISSLLEYQA